MMMRYELYCFFALISILFLTTGCEKDALPGEVSEEVKYRADLSVSGKEKKLEAGNKDYYLFTRNYSLDPLPVFYSSLRPGHCESNCTDAFEMYLRGREAVKQSTGIGDVLPEGDYSIGRIDTEPVYAFAGSVPQELLGEYNSYWVLNATDTIYGGEISIPDTFSAPVSLCLHFYEQGQEVFMKRCFWLGSGPFSHCGLETGIEFSQQYGEYSVSVIPSGTAPFEYLWSNGSTERETTFPDSVASYCVTVTDATSCRASMCRTFTGDFTSTHEMAPDSYLGYDTIYPWSFQPRDVVLRYIDPAGRVYTTPREGNDGSFTIENAGRAGSNELGETIYSFEYTFESPMEHHSGETIEVMGNGTFAISFPTD